MSKKRYPWGHFPEIFTHATASTIRTHPAYEDAASGDLNAAKSIVSSIQISNIPHHADYLVPVVFPNESGALNTLPQAFAEALAQIHSAKVVRPIFILPHPSGFPGLPSAVSYAFAKGSYIIVAAHVTRGSEIAAARGLLMENQCTVTAATSLSADLFSRRLQPTKDVVEALEKVYGKNWCQETHGFPTECLTNREAYQMYPSP